MPKHFCNILEGIIIQTSLRQGHYQTSLVAQWLRIHLPMQGTRVRALGQEDPTRCRAT